VTESQDKRRYARQKPPKPVLVAWKTGSERHVSAVDNLGLGGLFIRTKNPPKEGTSLQLLFNAPGGEVRVLAMVRNVVPGKGMGVAIVSMDQEQRARLDHWMRGLSAKEESPVLRAKEDS